MNPPATSRSLRLLLEVMAVVAVVEMAVMLVLPHFASSLGPIATGALDVGLLTLLVTPFALWRMRRATTRAWGIADIKAQGPASYQRALALAGLTQVAGLALTAGLVLWAKSDIDDDRVHQWTHEAQRVEAEVLRRFQLPLQGLRSLEALIASTGDGVAPPLQAWMGAWNLATDFPGSTGFGLIEPVPRSILSAWAARQASAHAPWLLLGSDASGEVHYAITRLAGQAAEHLASRDPADTTPWLALQPSLAQAVQTRDVVLSAALPPGQPLLPDGGFVYLQAVYRGDSLRGLVFTPLNVPALLQGVTRLSNPSMQLRLSVPGTDGPHILYDSQSTGSTPAPLAAQSAKAPLQHSVQVAGQTLTLLFSPGLDEAPPGLPPMLAYLGLAGCAISTLLSLGIWMLVAGRSRAEGMAAHLSKDLDLLSRVARHTTNLVSVMDAQGRITWVNQGFTQRTGYRLEEALGQQPDLLLASDQTDPDALQALTEGLLHGTAVRVEVVHRAKDGHCYWLETERSPFFDAQGLLEGFIEVGADVSRQKSMQKHLEASTRDAHTLIHALERMAMVTIADAQGHITEASQGLCETSGYSRAELIGQSHRLLNSGHHASGYWASMWDTVAKGTPWRGEICNRKKDGALFWVDTMAVPYLDEAGTVTHYVTIGIDITQRKHDEEALAQASHRLELAIEGGNDGLWDWMDLDSDIQWWSPNYYALLGYTPAQIPPRASRYMDLLHPDSRAANQRCMQDALAQRSGFELDVQLRTADRGYRWFRTRAKVYCDAMGEPTRMAGATQDIHEAKLVAQALAANEAFLATAGRLSGVGGWKLHVASQTMTWTHETRLIHEVDADFMPTPEGALEFYPPQARGRMLAAMQAALDYGTPWDLELPLVTARQRTRWVRVVGTPEGEKGQAIALVGALQDITERKRSEEQLRQALTTAEAATLSKGQLLANLSHEIRTPLHAVVGMLRLLEKTPLSGQQADYLGKSQAAAESLLDLLNDVLDLSKAEAGKMTLAPEALAFEGFLRHLSSLLSAYVSGKSVEVLYDIDARLPHSVLVDPLRLKQVLLNLASNAVKFTERGYVIVRLEVIHQDAQSARLRFSVRDTGIGISPQQQGQLFRAFSQAEASSAQTYGGTGLGLAISQQLVHLMGSEITVESSRGAGSTFSFTLDLPVVQGPASAAHTAQALRVLLVDDNPVARQINQSLCEAQGWECVAVGSGEAAVKQVSLDAAMGQPPFDAALIDWYMTGKDGWATSAQLRALPRPAGYPPLRIVMLTGHDRAALLQRPTDDHALIDGYLFKPVTARMLHEALSGQADGWRPIEAAPVTAPRHLAGLRLLLVEDNPVNRQVLEELLTDAGATVTLATNGRLGLDAVAQAATPFDLVLMDVQMPVMDGFAATAALRQHFSPQALPIVALTANALPSDRADCLQAGMNDYVAKPVDMPRLCAVILRQTGREVPPEWAPASPDPATPANPSTRAVSQLPARAALRQLQLLMRGGELAAVDCFAQVQADLAVLEPADLQALEAHVQALDFTQALALTERLLARLPA